MMRTRFLSREEFSPKDLFELGMRPDKLEGGILRG